MISRRDTFVVGPLRDEAEFRADLAEAIANPIIFYDDRGIRLLGAGDSFASIGVDNDWIEKTYGR